MDDEAKSIAGRAPILSTFGTNGPSQLCAHMPCKVLAH